MISRNCVIGFAACLIGQLFSCLGVAGQPIPASHVDRFDGRPRVIVISDIGNEPDDQMSMTRLLLYSDELDIEALVAATSTWQKTVVHPETMRDRGSEKNFQICSISSNPQLRPAGTIITPLGPASAVMFITGIVQVPIRLW